MQVLPSLPINEEIDSHDLFRERILLGTLAFLLAILTCLDLYEDFQEGVTFSHIFVEGTVFLIAISLSLVLWHRGISQLKSANFVLGREVNAARKDAEKWKTESANLMKGLGVAIESQFKRWQLSSAEGEVGVLLIKGLSHKEVAEIRGTTEKTVRQQAAAIYSKAGVSGRAELAAFFLEDLLLPLESINLASK